MTSLLGNDLTVQGRSVAERIYMDMKCWSEIHQGTFSHIIRKGY